MIGNAPLNAGPPFGEGPEEDNEPLTLCIAAECEFENEAAIAICCDWRAQVGTGEGPSTGSEDSYKMLDWRGATAMLAGSATMARELASRCRPVVEAFCASIVDPGDMDIAISDLQGKLRGVAANRKREIFEHLTAMSTGSSLEDFWKLPHEQFFEEHAA